MYSFYFYDLCCLELLPDKTQGIPVKFMHGTGCGRHSANLLSLPLPSLLPSVETVNDGQFHSVELVMLNQTLNLVVDKGAPKSLGKLQKQPAVSINSPLYLGGKPHLLPPVPCTLVPTPRPTGGAHSSHLNTHCQSQSGRLPGGSDGQDAS